MGKPRLLSRREATSANVRLNSQRINIGKRIADGINDELRYGRESGHEHLEAERSRIWGEICAAKQELASLTELKRRLIEEAGITPLDVRISLDELPCSPHEYNTRLAGLHSPEREELARKMVSTGLVQSFADVFFPDRIVPW